MGGNPLKSSGLKPTPPDERKRSSGEIKFGIDENVVMLVAGGGGNRPRRKGRVLLKGRDLHQKKNPSEQKRAISGGERKSIALKNKSTGKKKSEGELGRAHKKPPMIPRDHMLAV